MKNTKKVLSVVLAVIMALSALTLVAFAHSWTGVEDDSTVSVKYEVTQVASAFDTYSETTYTAVDNDIYAVTVYAKTPANNLGMLYFAVPIQYDNTKFEPMMLMDEGDLYCGYPGFYGDVDIKDVSFYKLPERFSDPNMYKADGTVTTSSVQGKVLGLGNSKAGALTVTSQFEDVGVPGADVFTAGYPADRSAVLVILDDSSLVSKTAWLNTENGLINASDYLEMITVYFHRIDGVSEADCYGAEFGCAANSYGTQITCFEAANGGYAVGTDPKIQINYINGAVEAPIKPLMALTALNGAKSQAICFNLAEGATPTYTADDVTTVDYRFVAQFSTTAYPIAYNESTHKITNANGINEVGFVMAKVGDATEAQISAMSAADVAALSKDSGTIRKCWTAKLSTDMAGGSAFAFSCRIKGIAVTSGTVASEYIAVPYIIKNNNIEFGQAMTSTAQAKYDANIAKFLAKKNG